MNTNVLQNELQCFSLHVSMYTHETEQWLKRAHSIPTYIITVVVLRVSAYVLSLVS
jgi:hypothetical protein